MTDFSFEEFLPSDDVVTGVIGDSEDTRPRAANPQESRKGSIAAKRLENTVRPRTPERTEYTRPVIAVIGSDGLPESIRVNKMWQDKIHPENFGSAVQEASRQAMASWSKEHPRPRSWPERRPEPQTEDGTPQARESQEPAIPRPLDEIAEDLIQMLDSAIAASETKTAPAPGKGNDSSNRIVVTLTQDRQLSCVADARWVASQSNSRLNQELSAALAMALQDLQNESADTLALSDRASRISAESLAVIRRTGHS